MHQRDVAALNKSLGACKRLSSRYAAEIAALQLRCGWKAAAIHASILCQRNALNLPSSSLAPCELKSEKVAGLGPEVWLVDIHGTPPDEFRWLSASILRSLLRLGLSRFEAHPTKAIEAEEARREALGIATEPAGDAA
jgi:hypothetical protein